VKLLKELKNMMHKQVLKESNSLSKKGLRGREDTSVEAHCIAEGLMAKKWIRLQQ